MRWVSDFEKEAVTRLMNRVVELRDRGEHDGVQLPGSSDNIPFARDLYGNLGALVFLNDAVPLGEGWIASSLSTKYVLEDYFQIRHLWFLGPKASFEWLRKNDSPTFAAFERALEPAADDASISRLVVAVAGPIASSP